MRNLAEVQVVQVDPLLEVRRLKQEKVEAILHQHGFLTREDAEYAATLTDY